ncbi:lipocalin Can f 6.0101-like [Myotis myotis]|uniref:lipocalin Can f 6.0101-like n=1 Tax=Myotis myotis TaxID=51298 RepID=UPI00174AEE70|nr:lipocalin Can f 6.0101-like [Myotis myotis]
MKLLLLCLGLTLVCAHHEGNHDVVTSNFDISKISGEWHTVFLASDVKEMIEKDSVMRGFMESIHAWDNSSLTLKFHIKVNGECTEMFLLCHQANENGVYNVIYAGFNTFRIIEVVYSDYIIFHLINVNNKQTFEMLILLARKPDVSPKLKERFEELCQEYGIPEENILDATEVDRCLQARGSDDAQASRLVMSDGEGVAQGPLPSNTIRGLCPKITIKP